jgi:hypothetical protein
MNVKAWLAWPEKWRAWRLDPFGFQPLRFDENKERNLIFTSILNLLTHQLFPLLDEACSRLRFGG